MVPVPSTTKSRPFSPDTMTRGAVTVAKEFLGDGVDMSWGGEDWVLEEADCGAGVCGKTRGPIGAVSHPSGSAGTRESVGSRGLLR